MEVTQTSEQRPFAPQRIVVILPTQHELNTFCDLFSFASDKATNLEVKEMASKIRQQITTCPSR